MDDERHRHMRALIAAIAAGERDLPAHRGPSQSTDRSQPQAAQWLRRWRPVRGYPVALACSCPAGRCATCN